MAEQIKFGDRLFLKGEKVLFDNGVSDAVIESRNGTLVIKGNLTVEGTTTTVNTTETTIADPHLLITGLAGSVDNRAGIQVERGVQGDESDDAKFSWDEANLRWTTNGGSLDVDVLTADTVVATTGITGDIISENGITMLDITGDGSVDLRGGNIDGTVIGATTPASAYFTTITGDGTNITNVLTNYSTDDLSEGSSNLYYTDERVDDRLNEILDAGYGITGVYDDPAGTYGIAFDATNIGTGSQVLDTSNTTQAAFRAFAAGPNLDLTVAEDGDRIVIDTAVKINNLEFNSFTGTGAVNQFTLPYTVSQDWQVLVYVDGVVQEPTTAYSVTGNTLTLSAPLANGSVMNVIKMASNTVASTVTDADTLNAQPGSYYLDYTNFTNTPTIPTVPTNVSAFTNDAGYITNADIPTNHMVTDANNTVSGSQIPSQDATYDLGTATEQWNVIYGHTVEATYADLAERYAADAPYEPGTVLVLGGEAEVTTTTLPADSRVIGVVSTDPGLKLNSQAGGSDTHPYIALKGRIPCKVIGKVEKGDLLVTAQRAGCAKSAVHTPSVGTVIGKAMESKPGTGEGVIEIFVSMM